MYQLPVCPRTSLRGRRDRSRAQSFGLVEVFWWNKQNKLKKKKKRGFVCKPGKAWSLREKLTNI